MTDGEPVRDPASVIRAVVTVARENRISLAAAGVAFYVFNSLIPLLLFVVIGLSVAGQLEAVAELGGTLAAIEGERAVSMVEDVLGDGTGRLRAAAIAGVILAWSSLTMVQAVNVAFGVVYDVRDRRSKVTTALNTVMGFLTVVVVVPSFVVAVALLTVLVETTLVRLLALPLLFAALFVAFLPMYVRFPGEEVSTREAVPGAAFAAVGWTLCAVGFRVYLAGSESVQLYGVAGGVMLLLTWLYLGGLTLLLGVILNAVLAGRVTVESS